MIFCIFLQCGEFDEVRDDSLDGFEQRRFELLSSARGTPYEKQKTKLVVDFVSFLETHSSAEISIRTARSPVSATPEDVIKFLFSRDSKGRTQVHVSGCAHIGLPGFHSCGCPVRLAAGTINQNIGKLRAFFRDIGRSRPYAPGDPLGNPCASPAVLQWDKASAAEQRRARITPHQAPPIFSEHLRFIVETIRGRIAISSAPFIPERFALYRDLAFFLVQWFSGDRAHDLGSSLGREVTRLGDGSLLFKHVIGKTIRQSDGDLIVVPRVPEELALCPVRAVEEYVDLCKLNGIDVVNDFLFRPLKMSPSGPAPATPFSSSNATKRLRLYLKNAPFDSSTFTAHGFRAGCAITLLLLDCSPEAVKSHCRWASDRVFSHYTKVEKVSRLEGTAAALRDGVSPAGVRSADDVAEFYSALNSDPLRSRAF